MKKTNNFLLLLNIFFLLYYGIQLLVYTDEFALNNLGIFNHAVAGLSEIIGIIFLSLSISLNCCFSILGVLSICSSKAFFLQAITNSVRDLSLIHI